MYIDLEGILEEEKLPIEKLEELGIPFIRLTHSSASTMELCDGIGVEYNARHCKNLFLTNRSENKFYLLMMDADKPFKTSEVSRKLGSSRLSFGSAEKLSDVLGLKRGAVSVLGMLNPNAVQAYEKGCLHVAVDRDVLSWENICVHPNVDTSTLVLRTVDLVKLLNGLGIAFETVDI